MSNMLVLGCSYHSGPSSDEPITGSRPHANTRAAEEQRALFGYGEHSLGLHQFLCSRLRPGGRRRAIGDGPGDLAPVDPAVCVDLLEAAPPLPAACPRRSTRPPRSGR